jgi:hypothetical protein
MEWRHFIQNKNVKERKYTSAQRWFFSFILSHTNRLEEVRTVTYEECVGYITLKTFTLDSSFSFA